MHLQQVSALLLTASTVLPRAAVYTVAAAEGLRRMLTPQADYFNTLGLPEALVHWGHPGAMLFIALSVGW